MKRTLSVLKLRLPSVAARLESASSCVILPFFTVLPSSMAALFSMRALPVVRASAFDSRPTTL